MNLTPVRGASNSQGNSFAMGPDVPKAFMGWQFQELMKSQVSNWDFLG